MSIENEFAFTKNDSDQKFDLSNIQLYDALVISSRSTISIQRYKGYEMNHLNLKKQPRMSSPDRFLVFCQMRQHHCF